MPNLAGIHDPSSDRASLEADLARMLAAIDLPAFGYTKKTAVSEGIAVGNVLTGVEDNLSQPARDAARGLWLMIDGELLNAAELRVELRRNGLGSDPATGEGHLDDAGLALQAYLLKGLDFVDRLNGTFNLVLHDQEHRTTYLISDRIGSRILFYAEDGPRFTFSSEAKGVIAGRKVPTKAGGLGLVQLLASHSHVGSTTWLEGVRVLEPGTMLRLGAGARGKRRYWQFHFREGGPELSEDEYAEGFARRLRKAVDRTMKGKERGHFAITLSGGLDSRSIALSFDRAHLPIRSITYGDPESPDVAYAAQLAELIGLDHMYIETQRQALEDASERTLDAILGALPGGARRGFYSLQADRIAWRAEGMTALHGLASMIWHPIYAREMRVMLNGACGDALTGSHLSPKLLLDPPRRTVIDDLRRSVLWQQKSYVAEVLEPAFLARHWDELTGLFASTFDDIDADEPAAVANIWDMENRQRRGAFASFTIERYFCTVRAPYVDYELAEFLSSVPARWRFQQRIYKRMIVKQFPEARHVPWAYTRGRITTSPAYEFAREAFNFGLRRAKALLPSNKNKAPEWEFRDAAALLREDPAVYTALEGWLSSDGFPSDVFSASGIRGLLGRFRAGEGALDVGMLVAHLLGIARFHGWFLSGSIAPLPPEADPSRFGVVPAG